MPYKISMVGLTDIGKVRETNEDDFHTDPDCGVMIVADGMGGRRGGEVASRTAVETIVRRLRDSGVLPPLPGEIGSVLEAALQLASDTIREQGNQSGDLRGMGSTALTAVLANGKASFANVGDSRAYLWRNGSLNQLTSDQNFAGALYEAGLIDTRERNGHPGRYALLQYLGMDLSVVPEFIELELRPRDRILLCTDGLSEMLCPDEIAAALALPNLHETGQALVTEANNAGGHDNITVVLAEIQSAENPYPKRIRGKIFDEINDGEEEYGEKR